MEQKGNCMLSNGTYLNTNKGGEEDCDKNHQTDEHQSDQVVQVIIDEGVTLKNKYSSFFTPKEYSKPNSSMFICSCCVKSETLKRM